VDINPLPLACAKKLIEGEALELTDFPVTPKDIRSYAVKSKLRAREPLREGFEFLVHDLEEWALRGESFDLVLTPWFIDVSPFPAGRLFALINQVLKPGGFWLNHGPVGFNKRMLSQYYSVEEVLHLASKTGFKVLKQTVDRLPYFQHPDSGYWRLEQALSFAAEKVSPCADPGSRQSSELPAWVEDTGKPIETALATEEMQKGFEFSLALCKKLRERKSIRELAGELSQDFALTVEQAEYLISSTLMQWQDLNRYNPMK